MARIKKVVRKTGEQDDLNFWQSSSDLLTALILLLLLIILLLTYYIFDAKWNDYDDYNPYENNNQGISNNYYTGNSAYNGRDGKGGNDGDGPEGSGKYNEEYQGDQSAVFVQLIDGESGKNVNEKGVKFSLYRDKDKLQTLNVYYPEKKSYKQFETNKRGNFYLPDKIEPATYTLKQVSGIDGYDVAEDTEIVVDGIYDWDAPLEVSVELFPERDIIKVQLNDNESGKGVPGGEFEILAEEEIATKDGTSRAKTGEVVGTIKCDENGYGESEKLYIGKYSVRQSAAPDLYANSTDVVSVDLEKQKAAGETVNSVNEFVCERTKIILMLTDELTMDPVSGAEFEINGKMYKTDSEGYIRLEKVRKNTSYEITQISSAEGYQLMDPLTLKVSKNGRIDRKAVANVDATNRLIRVDVAVKAAVTGSFVAGKELSLYKDGALIEEWASVADASEFTGLETGEYEVKLGDESHKFKVEDTAEIQTMVIKVYTGGSYAAIAAIALAAAGLAYGAAVLARYIKRKRKKKGELG